MRPLGFVLLLLITSACAPSASSTPTPFDCAFTKPRNVTPPPLPASRDDGNDFFARSGVALFVHFNETLAVRLPDDGTLLVGPGGDGVKLGWIRLKDGPLTVSAKRLDVPGIVRVDMADNYGNSGLQITGIRFPGAGCYSVTGAVAGGAPLTFVTRVAAR